MFYISSLVLLYKYFLGLLINLALDNYYISMYRDNYFIPRFRSIILFFFFNILNILVILKFYFDRIPRDVKSFVYCEGIRNGSKENWYTVMDRWLNADLQIEQELLLQALGCTQKANLIET